MGNDSVNVRKCLADYAARSMPYAELREQLVEAYGKAVQSSDAEVLKICRAAEWEIAEYSEGLIAETELMRRLASLNAIQVIVHPGLQSTAIVSGTSTVLQVVAEIAVQPVGVGRALVYASAGPLLG
jgi:hypothetical protein